MTPEIISVLATFAPLFTRPTWKNINTLIIGAILCRGARRITTILRVMGLSNVKNFSIYHRVLSRARWDSLAASKILFGLLVTLLPTHWPIIIAVDETLERRRGKKIKAKGAYRDAVASSQSRVEDPSQVWQSLTVKWYGGEQCTIECLTFECLWYHAGEPPLRLRIVLVKTPNGKNEAETFFSTDIANSPTQIIEWFVLRWNIEVTFEETRAHLGIETQRQWSDQAIARTTPLLMALLSILVLVAIKMHESKKLVVQETTSWYDKKGELTLGDIIMVIRRSIWVKMYFSTSNNQEKNTDSLKITEKNANLLIYQLALAA